MRGDVQDIFKQTPHDKQVMMFSATLSQEIRPVCKKFMTDVCPLSARPVAGQPGAPPSMAPLTTVLSLDHRLLTPRSKQADSLRAAENPSTAVFTCCTTCR